MGILKIVLFVLLIPFAANAADYTNFGKTIRYIRPDATGAGTGLNWTDAYTTIPSSLTRDYIYMLADGSYGAYTFNDAESGTERIYIVKATTDDHGTNTGWDDSYGDGEALFQSSDGENWEVQSEYWTFDGQKRDSWDGGYGIRLTNTTPMTQTSIKVVDARNVDHVSFYYVDMGNRGEKLADGDGDDGYYGVDCNNVIISHCYIHDISRNGIVWNGDNLLFEHSLMKKVDGVVGVHAQGLQVFGASNNMTVRNNVFDSVSGTAVIAVAWGMDGMYVHGNVFYSSDISYTTSPATIVDISEANEIGITNALVFNNTFYGYDNTTGHAGMTIAYTPDPSTNRFTNNLFVNCDDIAVDGDDMVVGYNHYVSSVFAYGSEAEATDSVYTESDVFINPSVYDFSLKPGVTAIDDALTLGTPYSYVDGYESDIYGAVRGYDGTWDVGAAEFETGETKTIYSGSATFGSGSATFVK